MCASLSHTHSLPLTHYLPLPPSPYLSLSPSLQVVPADTVIPRGQFWAGNPAKYVRDTDEVELGAFDKLAEAHYMVAEQHIDEILPYGTVYQEAEKL